MLKEFKEFALRGSVVDLAIGVIIGAAFGKIVTSLVNDIIMPPIGIVVNGVDFSRLSVVLRPETINQAGETVAAVTLNYGEFINTIIGFLIVALAVFALVKAINTLKKKEEEKPKEEKVETEIDVLKDIRDSLKQ
jgi:large conductance mechanosensitive channel